MLISVVMTTYNGARFVRRQLDSLAAQTRPPDDVVILDDHSRDETAAVVRAFLQERALPWRFSVNAQNVGATRNFKRALSLASGDVICTCDQDDQWLPGKLARMEELFRADKDMLALGTSFAIVNGRGRPIPVPNKRGRHNHNIIAFPVKEKGLTKIDAFANDPMRLVAANFTPGCCTAYRRSVVARYLKSTKCALVQDWEMNLIADAMGGLYYLDEEWVAYRQHGDNVYGVATGKQRPALNGERRRKAHADLAAMPDILAPFCQTEQQKDFVARLRAYAALRGRMLAGGGMGDYFRLYRYLDIYLRLLKPRGLAGDLLYVLKGKRGGA